MVETRIIHTGSRQTNGASRVICTIDPTVMQQTTVTKHELLGDGRQLLVLCIWYED